MKAMPLHLEGIASGAHYASVSHSRHPNVCNEQPFLSHTTCVLRMSLSSDTLHFFGSFLSGNPSSTCMFSPPIHSATLVGRYWSTGWCFRYAYSSHTRSAGAERSILSGATADTASEALDPGERRLFLLADQPGKPTNQEKSKYETYTQRITNRPSP